MARSARFDVKDLALAPDGIRRLDLLEHDLPVLAAVRARFARERPLGGVRVAACLHVTAAGGALARTIAAGGADLVLCAAGTTSTEDDVAAALVVDREIPVLGIRDEEHERYYAHLDAACDHRPQVALDHGGDMLGVLHGARREQLGNVLGGTVDAATGAMRMRALEAASALAFPVVAVFEADSLHLLDDTHGSSQGVFEALARIAGLLLAGTRLVIAGYGVWGRELATRARGSGAIVTVTEVDPGRALAARLDGFDVMPMRRAAALGDVFLTATGGRHAIASEHLELMRDGVVLGNAGHSNVEIELAALRSLPVASRPRGPGLEAFTLPDGRELILVAKGRVVNHPSLQPRPSPVEDVVLAAQALAVEYLVVHAPELERRVSALPAPVDRELASLKLGVMGVEIDRLTDDQARYLRSWAEET